MPSEAVSRADRMDPGGEQRRLAAGLTALSRPPWSVFLRLAGVPANTLAQSREAADALEAYLGTIDETAEVLAPLGWAVFEGVPSDAYETAARCIQAGHIARGEDLIVEAWNEAEILLRRSVHQVQTLYRSPSSEHWDLGRPDVAHERSQLILEAAENHFGGRFASAITLVLTQIEGVVADFSDGGTTFFSRDRTTGEPRAKVTDQETLAGHPHALQALAKLYTTTCKTTETSGRLVRHGISHGRELGYGNRRNSTQALATLLAVITWARPIAKSRLDDELRRYETRWVGSEARDDDGRRRDRRGFAEAKNGLTLLGNLQDRYFERHDRYARSVDEIDPDHLLRGDMFPGVETRCSDDGRTYWAWARPAGYALAVGGRDGEATRWEYAGDKLPRDGPGSSDDWRNSAEDPPHPDW